MGYALRNRIQLAYSPGEMTLCILGLKYGVGKIRQHKGDAEVTGADDNTEHGRTVCVTRRELAPLINIHR
ncbi:hypothetical protein PSAC2689_210007 [Paraburkholderia sacchari]